MSARTASATPRVLDLDRDLAAVVAGARGRPGRSRRRRSASRRTPRRRSASFSPSSDSMTLRMSEKRTFGAASRSSPSLRWNSSRYSSGTRPTSRKRHHLAELHRRALHRPERGDDLLGGLDVARLERGSLALLARARSPSRADLARGLAGREPDPAERATARSGCGPWPCQDGRRGCRRRCGGWAPLGVAVARRDGRAARAAGRGASGVASRRRRRSASASAWRSACRRRTSCGAAADAEPPKIAARPRSPRRRRSRTPAAPVTSAMLDRAAREDERRARARAGRTGRPC